MTKKRSRKQNNNADDQVQRINQMHERHMAAYSQMHKEIQAACETGDVSEIQRLTQKFSVTSKAFTAEIDAEAAILNRDLQELGIK